MNDVSIRLHSDTAKAPTRQRAGDLGYDLYSDEAIVISPGERKLVQTNVSIALPPNVAGLVVPRSGTALKAGVTVNNAPGLIDTGYRGTIGIIAINHSDEPFHVSVGDRIAQLLLVPVVTPQLAVVDELPPGPDERGSGGFGSSGRN